MGSPAFTLIHVIISIIGIVSGLIVVGGLLSANRMPINAERMQCPSGCPWVMSRATESAAMISEKRICVAAISRPEGGSFGAATGRYRSSQSAPGIKWSQRLEATGPG